MIWEKPLVLLIDIKYVLSKHKTFVQCRSNVFDVGPTLYKCKYKCFVFAGSEL